MKYEFVGLQDGSALQEFLTDQAARMGGAFQYRVRLPSAEAVCRMVERKVGVGILPIATATRLTHVSAIRMAELDELWASRKPLICTQSFADLPSYAQHLVNHLRDDIVNGVDRGQS